MDILVEDLFNIMSENKPEIDSALEKSQFEILSGIDIKEEQRQKISQNLVTFEVFHLQIDSGIEVNETHPAKNSVKSVTFDMSQSPIFSGRDFKDEQLWKKQLRLTIFLNG